MISLFIAFLFVLAGVIVFGPAGLALIPFAIVGWWMFLAACQQFHWFRYRNEIHSTRTLRRRSKRYVEMPPVDGGIMTDLYIAQQLARKRKAEEDESHWW